MPIPTADKTKAKRYIMRIVEPAALAFGFTKHSGCEFVRAAEDSSTWRLLFGVPTFDSFYRIHTSIERACRAPILGPYTEDYEAPNHPGDTRYNFRFHLAAETCERCAGNLVRWMHAVAIPWFQSSPATSWRNPNLPR